MTASGQRLSVENVAAPKPSHGSGQVDVTTPLPDGWASFCSRPDRRHEPHWYATPPYNVTALHKSHGGAAAGLIYTVEAKSWERLHTAVAEQVELYEALCTGADA